MEFVLIIGAIALAAILGGLVFKTMSDSGSGAFATFGLAAFVLLLVFVAFPKLALLF